MKSKSTKSMLTLKQLNKAYKKAKLYDDFEKNYVYPNWKYWIYKLQPWKYKEIMKGVFLTK